MHDDWQETEQYTQRSPLNLPTIDPFLVLLALGALLVIAIILLTLHNEYSIPSKSPTHSASATPSSPTSSSDKGQIVVNVDRLERDPYLNVTSVTGKVKNFTNKTLETVKLRFTFYDRLKKVVHTETRVIFLFENFRPNDVYAFKEDFFNLPKEARFIFVEVEEAW